jgi:hypothetical protein
MADRPTAVELLQAIQRFVDEELMDELEGVRRFHARVASNALGIVARELELGGESLERRRAQLSELLDDPMVEQGGSPEQAVDALERALVVRIRAGEADGAPFRDQVLAYLEQSVALRLAIDNPRHR